MAKEYCAGITYSNGVAHFAVFQVKERETKLLHLEEFINAGSDDLWYLEYILNPKIRAVKKIERVSVGLDMMSLLLHQFPLDITLSQPDQNEHVHWELSNLIKNYQAKDYIYDLHVLKIRQREQVAEVLAVSVEKLMIYRIQEALAKKKIDLYIADTAYFGAEQTLLMNYTQVNNKTVALLYTTENRIDIGLLINGTLVNYRYTMDISASAVINILKEISPETMINEVYCCGPSVPVDLKLAIQTSLVVNVGILNPFRQMITTSSFDQFDSFVGREHRFAGAVGMALRQI